MVDWSCTKMDEFQFDSFDYFVFEADNLDDNEFGVDFFDRKLEMGFMYFLRFNEVFLNCKLTKSVDELELVF